MGKLLWYEEVMAIAKGQKQRAIARKPTKKKGVKRGEGAAPLLKTGRAMSEPLVKNPMS